MKFYKQLKLNKNLVKSVEYTQKIGGLIVMDVPFTPPFPGALRSEYKVPTLRGIRIPTGPDNERPTILYGNSGVIRYNTDGDCLEVLTNGDWVQLKAKQPANITIQRFGASPLDTRFFIDPEDPEYEEKMTEIQAEETYRPNEPTGSDSEVIPFTTNTYVDGVEIYFGPIRDRLDVVPKSPANVFVYVENVFQIPYTNYRFVTSGAAGKAPSGTYLAFESPPPPGKTVTVIHGFD